MSRPTISRWYCSPTVEEAALREHAALAAQVDGRAQAFHRHIEGEPCGPGCELIHPCGASSPIEGGLRIAPFGCGPELAAALQANRATYEPAR